MTIENEEGTAHFMVTSCSYSADRRIASISRLKWEPWISPMSQTTEMKERLQMAMTMMAADREDRGGGATDDDGGSATAPGSSGGGGAIFGKITQHILFDKDGLIEFKAKSGELPIDADAIVTARAPRS